MYANKHPVTSFDLWALVFICLKFTGYIDWHWLLVCWPIWLFVIDIIFEKKPKTDGADND